MALVTEPCQWNHIKCAGTLTYDSEDREHLFEVECSVSHTTWFWRAERDFWETFDPRPDSA